MALDDATNLAEKIRSLVLEDNLHRASIRLLDYSKQFSSERDLLNASIALSREIKNVQWSIKIYGESSDKINQLNSCTQRLLAILDEVENQTSASEANLPWLDLQEYSHKRLSETVIQSVHGRTNVAAPSRLEQARNNFQQCREEIFDLTTPAVKAYNIGKFYRGGFTLSGITFNLYPTEIIGLVGANGSGKSTLLRILAGELARNDGDLTYPLLCPEKPNWALIRSQIGFVPQRPIRWFGSLEDNLHIHAALRQLSRRENEDEVEFILHRFSLDAHRKARWDEMSAGLQMRFELATTLISQPKLLILDEPLAPLDINTQQTFLQDLRDIANSHSWYLPIIISSQHIYEIESIANTIIFLSDGKAAFSGDLNRLYQERTESTYEIISKNDNTTLLSSLSRLGAKRINNTGPTQIISMPPETTSQQVLGCLIEANIDISYFRDISGSTRKLFKTQIETE